MSRPIRVLVFQPYKTPFLERIYGEFTCIASYLGGHLGRIRLEPDLWLCFDDDGIPRGLEPNLWAEGPLYMGATIYGTAVLVSMHIDGAGSEHYRDVSKLDVAKYLSLRRMVTAFPGACICGGPLDGHFPDCQPAPYGTRPLPWGPNDG